MAARLMLNKFNVKIFTENVEAENQSVLCEQFDVDRVQGCLLGRAQQIKVINKVLDTKSKKA